MNNLFDLNYLRKYVRSELTVQEMYEIEKASHADEMLADIIAGLEEELRLKETFHKIDIDSAIYERTHPKKKIYSINYKWLASAASLLILLGSILTVYLQQQPDPIAADAVIASAPQKEESEVLSLPTEEADSVIQDQIASTDIPIQKESPTIKNGSKAPVPAEKTVEKKRIEELLTANVSPNRVLVNKDFLKREEKNWLDEDLQGRVAGISPKKNQNTSDFWIRGNQTFGAPTNANEAEKNTNSSIIVIGQSAQPKVSVVGAISSAKVSTSQNNKNFATGRVLDQSSGRPIVNASIKDLQNNNLVVTDSTGQYVLPIANANSEIEILSLGYESQRIVASNNKIVQLSPNLNDLDEVVVVGYSGRSAKFKSEPLVGWDAYKKYIDENASESLLGRGTVTLVFDINPFGRPMNIIIKRGETDALNQKAIRMVQNGPDWRVGNDGKKVEVKVSFK